MHDTVLREMLYDASGKAVFGPIKRNYGESAFDEMVLALDREIDRQAPVPPRRRSPNIASAERGTVTHRAAWLLITIRA